jgi:urocanate hydratase
MIVEEPEIFKQKVHESLIRHVNAINAVSSKGMKFWDYGNSFLLMASRAKADILGQEGSRNKFRYPSYVEDIMGDIF